MQGRDANQADVELSLEKATPSVRNQDQTTRLAHVLRWASDLPAYQDWKKDLRRATEVNALELLRELPITTRTDLQERRDEYVDELAGPLKEVATSGTSGQPLRFLRSIHEYEIERRYIRIAWRRLPITEGDLGAVLVGRRVHERDDHLLDPGRNLLWISCEELLDSTWDRAVELIDTYRPTYIRGYGSLVGEFFAYLSRSGCRSPRSVLGVAFASEPMLESQRRNIFQMLGRRPIGLYGQNERVVMGVTCGESDQYHIFGTYGLVEIVDAQGRLIHEPNVVGEVVGTSLLPRATAFLRYPIGDVAAWSGDTCDCGRTQVMLHALVGRTYGSIVDRRGVALVFARDVYSDAVAALPVGASVQFVHDHQGELEVRTSGCTADEQSRIEQLVRTAVGRHFRVIASERSPLRTAAGKQPLLASTASDGTARAVAQNAP